MRLVAMEPARKALPARAYVLAALLVTAATALAEVARSVFPVPDLEMLYLLAVMVAAVNFGRGPAILAAGLAVASYDFFFVPPFFTFQVANARYLLTFSMMFIVGLLLSELTARIRQQEQDAVLREGRTATLFALSQDVGSAEDADAAAKIITRHATEVFGATALMLHVTEGQKLRVIATHPANAELTPEQVALAEQAFAQEGAGASGALCLPLRVGARKLGVLALVSRPDAPLSAEQREFFPAFTRQAAFTFDRARLTEEARSAALRATAEEMRSSLLSTVSHDLRTPLAAITGAATSLRDDTHVGLDTRTELLETICEEADRLERLVANLLDMTRLESGKVVLKREWVPLEEIVGSALTRLERVLGDRPVHVDLPESLPFLSVDPVLFEQVLVNLIENASKYTDRGTPLELSAMQDRDGVVIEVRDRGPGLPKDQEQRVFEKFYRGTHTGVSGAGLGLPICRAIVEAHGGSIAAHNRSGGGAIFRLFLPVEGQAPPLVAEHSPP